MHKKKNDVIEAQELDHQTMVNSLIETCVSSAFKFIGATMCKCAGTKLKSRMHNDYFTYQITYKSSEIMISTYEMNKEIILDFFR